jgi:hypothetical protein
MKERNLYRERMWGGGASDSDGILRALLTRTERRNWKEGGGGGGGREKRGERGRLVECGWTNRGEAEKYHETEKAKKRERERWSNSH